MKSVWKGSISFGLVSIPISLYAANEQKLLSFKMLCKKHESPIRYERLCQKGGEEVPWDEIIKGFPIGKDNAIIIEKDELEKIKPKAASTIDIISFLPIEQIDTVLINKHYYLAPEKNGEKAYMLLQKAFESAAKAAVGRFVMKEKEHTCIIRPYKGALLLTTLFYNYEVRDLNNIEELKNKPSVTKEELKLANELVERMSKDKFDFSTLKDNFADEFKALMKKKLKGEKIVYVQKEKGEKRPADLMTALKASLER